MQMNFSNNHDYVTRAEFEELKEMLLCRGDNQTIAVDNTPGGQMIRSIQSLPEEATAESGLAAYYFSCEKLSDTVLRVSNCFFRAGKTMYDAIDLGGVSNTSPIDVDLGVTPTDGDYWIHFQALYDTSYAFTIESGTVDTRPDQADDGEGARAYREELCLVSVASNVISEVTQIWPGNMLSIAGVVP